MHSTFSFSSPRYIVTGANGFIGQALTNFFSTSNNIIPISRSTCSPCSLSFDYSSILGHKIDPKILSFEPTHLIHCAGIAHRSTPTKHSDLLQLERINIDLALQVAEFAKSYGVKRFVFISSIGVHGSSSLSSNVLNEASPFSPVNPYSHSKLKAELKLRECFSNSSCQLSIVRPALVYGVGMPGNLRKLICAIDAGLPFPLGLINNRRSFVSLINLISAIEAISVHPRANGSTFVVADKEVISSANLIRLIARVRNKSPRLLRIEPHLLSFSKHLPFIGSSFAQLIDNLEVDSSKIRNVLDWVQPVDQLSAMEASFAIS